MRPMNVFVVGLDEQNLETLRDVPRLAEYRFHRLLDVEELQAGDIPVADLLKKAERQLDEFDGPIDAIVGYWDFPVSTMLPVLCAKYDLPGAKLESVLKCEHKYWSRLVQSDVIDEHPQFALVGLEGTPHPPEGLRYPIWLKPVKSFSSDLAFKINDDDEFANAVEEIRAGIGRIGEPFEYLLNMVKLPPAIAEAGGKACLAEEALSGVQAATEGFSYQGEVVVYGVLDSLNYPGTSSFLRHQYPSHLPGKVVERMTDISKRIISHIGLDSSAFSIEFFCQPETGEVSLLEINPRHSQSHAELFEHVDGAPNHHCMLRLALGQRPDMPHREGEYAVAAKWLHRVFTDDIADGVVRRVPSRDEIEGIERDIPGVAIYVVPSEGTRLSEMLDQDAYSYELAELYIGGEDEVDMRRKFDQAVERMTFEIE